MHQLVAHHEGLTSLKHQPQRSCLLHSSSVLCAAQGASHTSVTTLEHCPYALMPVNKPRLMHALLAEHQAHNDPELEASRIKHSPHWERSPQAEGHCVLLVMVELNPEARDFG